MFKGSILKLILGAAILVICYAFPFFMMPVGSYTQEIEGVSVEYSFKWNGKYEKNIGDNFSFKGYHKVKAKDKEIYVGTTEDSQPLKLASVKSLYKIEIGDTEYVNGWGVGVAVVGYVLTAWGLLGLVLRKKR